MRSKPAGKGITFKKCSTAHKSILKFSAAKL